MARGWPSSAGISELIYNYIYSFYMPLVFLISGSLAIDGIRSNPSRALLSQIGSIAWPYLLWGMAFIAMEPVISQFTLSKSYPRNHLNDCFLGETSWFLWILFLANCI